MHRTVLVSSIVLGLGVVAGLAQSGGDGSSLGAAAMHPTVTVTAPRKDFRRETLVDFCDDVLRNGRPLTAADIDALMRELAARGIKRVSWTYYADGRGGFLNPSGYLGDYDGGWAHYDATNRELGNPLKVAVEAGHRHGLEVYAYFKPYENGPALMFPSGSPEGRQWGLLDAIGGRFGWMDPFVRDHPELRIKRRSDDLPADLADAPVRMIRLTKKDATPTRLNREHLQIWTSRDNYRYQPVDVPFSVTEEVVPAAREVRDHRGRLLTRQGEPTRVLMLTGLDLRDKFILVTTGLTDGAADFSNSGVELFKAYAEDGREIPAVFGHGGTIWCPGLADFRRAGVMFDYGWGAMEVPLDTANTDGKRGFIAFARGRNQYLPAALCETEPAVRAFWLACLDEIIAAGVDGVDFREENHSTHTDTPQDYGFNDVVLATARQRPGDLLANIAAVRGEAYTDFLRACKARLAAAGRRMRYNLQMDYFRPHPPAERLLAYPANVNFEWRRWIDEGLVDEAILRFYSLPGTAVFDDPVTQEMIARCEAKGVPLVVNRYVGQAGDQLPMELSRVQADGRFSGFIFYEVHNYLRFGPSPGDTRIILPAVERALELTP